MTDTTDPGDRLESIRRALAVVAADRPTPEQIAGWNTADREMAQRIRAALPGVPLHHAYAVLQALRVTQRLDADAAQPPASAPSAPADRAGLLDAAAQAIRDSNGSPEALEWWRTHPQLIPAHVYAAAVLSVLPPAADRAAVERVRAVLETEAVVGRSALEYRGLIASALMADEAQQAETQAPVHVGGNAEDCPACEGTNLPYPFICPQPEPAAAPVAGQPPAETGEAQPRFVRVCVACPECDHTLDENGACVNGCHVPAAVVAEPGKENSRG